MVDVGEIGKKLALAGVAVVALLAGCKKEPSSAPPQVQSVVEEKYQATHPELEAAVGFFRRGELDLAVSKLEEAKRPLQALADADPKYKKVLDGVNLLEEAVRLTRDAHDKLHERLKLVKESAAEDLAKVVGSWQKIPPFLAALRDCFERSLKLGNIALSKAILGTYATILRDWRVVLSRARDALKGLVDLNQMVSELEAFEKATNKEIVSLK